jgi:hypothetical protein
VEEALVLEDENTSGLGVYIDTLVLLPVEERRRTALEVGLRVVRD